jgi:GTP cyclohydrolase IA
VEISTPRWMNSRKAVCNETVDISEADRRAMRSEVAKAIEGLFDALRVDYRNDDNTRDTPKRVASMFVEELLRGRYTKPPAITEFENATSTDQLIVTGPIDVRSTCAHHLMPVYGEAYIGILPCASRKIIGLSKYDRIVDYFASRLQLQEALGSQIGQFIMDVTKPRGLAVRISAVHMCKTHRGVCSGHRSRMVNNCFFGEFLTDSELRSEFLEECRILDRHNSA